MSSPVRVAASLRLIAARIDMSKSPDRSLVLSDLRKVVHSLTREDRVRRIAAEMVRIAQEDVEMELDLSSWDTDEGKDVDSAYALAKKQTVDEKLVPALNSLKGDIDALIGEIKSPGSKKDDDEGVETSAKPRRDIR